MPSKVDDMAEFYDLLATDYDTVAGYTDAAAEELRAPIKKLFRECMRGHDVLEIACGTGYWTKVIATTAKSVLATDISDTMIALARKRLEGLPHVRCQIADAYSLESVEGEFTAGIAHWWWSHVPKSRMPDFLAALNSRLAKGALVLFADHLENGWWTQTQDDEGDSIDVRALPGGRTFEVVKNFPTPDEVVDSIAPFGDEIDYTAHPEFKMWTVTYHTK